jgi:ketosteroid isomerase-like protein
MFTADKNKEIANAWFEAFNSQQLDWLLSLYANDAEHYSPKLKVRKPETGGVVRGREALRSWWQDSFDRLPSLQYIPATITANDARVVMEYTRKVDGEPGMIVAEVLEIKNGLIVASRVYHG